MSTSTPRTLGILPWSLVGAPGVGSSRERALWLGGGWRPGEAALLEAAGRVGLPNATIAKLVAHRNNLNNALQSYDLKWLFGTFPIRQRWRLLPLVLDVAAGLDLELDGQGITALALWKPDGPLLWHADMKEAPPAAALRDTVALLTFNGQAFDVPIVRRDWPDFELPPYHVDLVAMGRKLAITGGLKGLEEAAGWTRPMHLQHLRGKGAVELWHQWQSTRDRAVLRVFLEYNLEDAFSLPYLAAWCHDRLVARKMAGVPGAETPAPLAHASLERANGAPQASREILDKSGR